MARAKTSVRRRPAHTLSAEHQKRLTESDDARAKNSNRAGPAAKSAKVPEPTKGGDE